MHVNPLCILSMLHRAMCLHNCAQMNTSLCADVQQIACNAEAAEQTLELVQTLQSQLITPAGTRSCVLP